MDQLKENLKKANARINQLENFIRQNNLSIPESDFKKEEDKEEKRKEIEEKQKEKDEDIKIEDIKKKIDIESTNIEDMINVTYVLLKEEDIYDNRLEIMANLKVLKEKIENNPSLQDHNSNRYDEKWNR